MGKTKRRNPYDSVDGSSKKRNPYAKELEKPQYRGRYVKDKRKVILEKLNEAAESPEDWGHGVRSSSGEGTEEREGSPPVGAARPNSKRDPSQEGNET